MRRRAEEMLLKQTWDKIPPADVQSVVHELRVHQIELEMQNEELRRVQHELEESREKYFDLHDLSPVGYVTLNEKGIIMESNLRAASLLGKERSDLVGQPITRFIFREDQDIYYRHNKQLFETRQNQECEVRMPKRDGTLFWARMETVVVRGKNGELALQTMISDITERKRAEDALRESEERFRALMTASSDVVYRMNPDCSEMRQLRGMNFINDTEKPDRNWLQEYIHPDDQSHVKAVINEAIRTKRYLRAGTPGLAR